MQVPGQPDPNAFPELPPATHDLAAMSPEQVDKFVTVLAAESGGRLDGPLRDDIYYFPLRDVDRAIPLYTTLTESQSEASRTAAAIGMDHLAIACRQRDGNIDAVLPIMVQLLITGTEEGEPAGMALIDLLERGQLSQSDTVDLVRKLVYEAQLLAHKVELDRGRSALPQTIEEDRIIQAHWERRRHTESGGEPPAGQPPDTRP